MGDPNSTPTESSTPARVLSVSPVVLPAPERGEDLRLRVSAPEAGTGLPVIIFSHGFGGSLDGYAPLVDFWAAHGFVVVQPTHLDSRTLNIAPDDPRTPSIWRSRVEDLTRALDRLDTLETTIPGLQGRIDHHRIAVAGHSWGAQTAGTLLGARVLDDQGEPGEDLSDPRVKVGVLLAAAGTDEGTLTPFAAEHFPFMKPSFATMSTPTLVVAGDSDQSALSTRGPDWWTDAYHLGPGATDLLTLFGAEHSLGGVAGYGVAETTDESPERVALIQRVSLAYLRDALGIDSTGWKEELSVLRQDSDPRGRLESK